MPRRKTLGADTAPATAETVVEPLADGKAMVLSTDGIGDQAPTDGDPADYSDEFTSNIKALHPIPDDAEPELTAATPGATGCLGAPNCAQAGRAAWKIHTDKTGERTTAREADGAFWNRSCPADTCAVRVYL